MKTELATKFAELEAKTAAADKQEEEGFGDDPESRLLPNKEGGVAPNYTPLATVDVDSGVDLPPAPTIA